MYLNSICNDKIPDSTRMTKDGGDDGMPELDDISKIGKKVRTRPSQKTIKTQDHLTRPSLQSSYLSQISRTIFVEKKLLCGEISAFYTEFEQFMEFLSKFMTFLFQTYVEKNLCGENLCGEKMTNMRYDMI